MTDSPYAAPAAFHTQFKSIIWDYARGVFSLSVIGGILSQANPGSVIWLILTALFIAFVIYTANTLWRHGLRLELDDTGITAGWHNPLDASGAILLQKRSLPWAGVRALKVRHFNRKREAKNLELMVAKIDGESADGKRISITFDGGHEGFHPVLAAVWAATDPLELMIDEASLANMESIGIETRGDGPWKS